MARGATPETPAVMARGATPETPAKPYQAADMPRSRPWRRSAATVPAASSARAAVPARVGDAWKPPVGGPAGASRRQGAPDAVPRGGDPEQGRGQALGEQPHRSRRHA